MKHDSTLSGNELLALCKQLKAEGKRISVLTTVGGARYRVTIVVDAPRQLNLPIPEQNGRSRL
jgi:hypothetical protein